eukprot:TRINITY_DN897_c0_g3_i4.p1 TRINITY_DN897_c0_g3~~TRINITY_DN897_c0_g3_i4.p1  ORF type:complete len:594 (-),score=106.66 TRINITY_DN897_c0_g3_i4:406-2187(-)
MEAEYRTSLRCVQPKKSDEFLASKSTEEILQAQQDAMLEVLESWLKSQEDRLSRLFVSCSYNKVELQRQETRPDVLYTNDSDSTADAADSCQEWPAPLCKVDLLPEDVAVELLQEEEDASPAMAPTASVASTVSITSSQLHANDRVPGEEPPKEFALRRRSTALSGISERLTHLQQEAKEDHYRCTALKAIVVHPTFEAYFAFLILVNAAFTCVEVELRLESPHGDLPPFFAPIGHILGLSFLFELVVRMAAYGKAFLFGPGWAWNCFDLFLVSSWCAEFTLDLIQSLDMSTTHPEAQLSVCPRKNRLLPAPAHLLEVQSMRPCPPERTSGMDMKECEDCEMDPLLHRYWGSLPKASLSLFQMITGGKDWDDVARPLMDLSGFLLVILIIFIIFSQFAVLNVVTGVFCQAAVESAQRDRELMVQSMVTNKQRFVDALGEQFASMFNQVSRAEGGLTLEAFEAHMHVKSVREYFALLELDSSDAWMLFKLLDDEGTGIIDVEQFVDGCLRLKGTARSIDLAKLSMEYKNTSQRFSNELSALSGHISDLQKAVALETPGVNSMAADSYRSENLLSVVCMEPRGALARGEVGARRV